jgi:uncharacterized membrane protein
MSSSNFLSKEEQGQVVTAIEAAELLTTGEIRVHIESRCKGDVMDRAATLFRRLKMDQTIERNGVLIYVAFQSRHFAVIGDTGIDTHVMPDFWKSVTDQVSASFVKRDFCGGICRAIYSVGAQLARYFSYKSGRIDELTNEISFDE